MEEEVMDNKEHIQAETNYIFNYDFNDNDIPEEVEEEYYDRASALLDEYSWNDIFNCWFDYLKANCNTPEEIINWANLFYWYGGFEKPIPDPYEFLGYLYFKVDVAKYVDEAQTVFDGIAIGILGKIGKVSLIDNPNYAPENDPEIIAAVERWKNR